MNTYLDTLRQRLRHEVHAYLAWYESDTRELARRMRRTPGPVDASRPKQISHRGLDGLLDGSNAQTGTLAQVRNYLLHKGLPAFALDVHPSIADMARSYMASHAMAHQTRDRLKPFSGTYRIAAITDEVLLFIDIVIDYEPLNNVLLARALVTVRPASKLLPPFIKTFLHGYAIVSSAHIYLHLQDNRQVVPYSVIIERDTLSEYPRQGIRPLSSVLRHWSPNYTSHTQILFPRAYWVGIAQQLQAWRLPSVPANSRLDLRASKVPDGFLENSMAGALLASDTREVFAFITLERLFSIKHGERG